MSTCSILNENTKEPKIFYKSTSGEEFSSLYDVLNNTSDSYEVGFKDVTETFVSKATIPVFDKSTKEGQIQGYIRNGYLSGKQVAPNTFEATDSLAADILEQDLLINNYNEFKREGNNFIFDDFTPDTSKFSELEKAQSEINQLYHELKGKKTKKEIRYTDSNLKNMIESFMKKVGFSTTTIAEYKQKYKTKFGIEPNAKVFIDLQKKIIAVANGEITLDQLSEEFSHFVIEAWNQDEIKRMLQTVNNTKEYIEHAENYRQIYSKQISDPKLLEEAVRREILGKMLANSLQKDFRLYDKTDTEITFFRKLSQILGDFIKFFKSKFNPSLQDEIDKMAQDIENRLYNDKLEESLDMNQTPILTIMYNADPKTHKKIYEAIGNPRSYINEVEKEIDQVFNTAISGAIAANDAMNNLLDTEVISHELGAAIEGIIGMEEVLERSLAYYRKIDLSKDINLTTTDGKSYINGVSLDQIKSFQRQLVEKGDKAVKEISQMKGLYKNTKSTRDPQVLLRLTAQQYSEKGAAWIEKMVGGIIGPQSDTSWFWQVFGHTAKMSNGFVRQLSEIINHLHDSVVIENAESKKQFIDALTPYRKKISDFLKDGYIMSGISYAKRENDKRAYELEKLKIVYPKTYEDMDIKTYIETHQQYGIPELLNRDEKYYQYKYEYDNGLEGVKWETSKRKKYTKEGLDKIREVVGTEKVWENLFYQRKIDASYDRKNAGSKIYLKQQRAETSPYNDLGELREGYEVLDYRKAKSNNSEGEPLYTEEQRKRIVSTNPRLNLFSKDDDGKNDGDIVFYLNEKAGEDAKLSFQYLKWNSINLGNKKTGTEAESEREMIKDNFRKEYQSFINKLEAGNLTEAQKRRDLKVWLNRSLMFEPTEEYWNNNQDNIGIDFKSFYEKANNKSNDYTQMLDREFEYKELSLRKQVILKKYKNQNDYKEVDIQEISQADKTLMEEIEDKMRDVMYKNREGAKEGTEILSIASLFEANDLKMYGSSGNATLKMNTAFKEYFKEQIGIDFEDANLNQYKKFFNNNANFNIERHAKRLSNLTTDLANKKESSLVVDYRDRARDLGMDESNNDNVMKAFYIQNSQSWYKRYDANESYDSFLKDYGSDKFDLKELIENYLESESDQIFYNNKPLDLMQITPSFRFATPVEENIDELYEQYLKPNLTDLQKLEIVQKMGGVEDIDPEYLEDISHIKNNPEDLKAYILMMDLRLNILQKDDMMKSQYVFLLPQQRISSYERFESLIKGDNKKEQIKDYIYESLNFRPDDYEENYKMSKIPKYGYFKLKPEEMTTDVFHALVWGIGNANLYQQRVKYFSDAAKMLDGLASQDFKNGKKATDTNYYKIAKEMMDFNIYGKTVSKKMEFEIPIKDKDGNNRRLDISKLLFGLKGFGVTMALGLSPIVAITNFISGAVQMSINHMVGRRLYKQANKRSIGVLAKMYPATLKDVGEFSPEAKINKIMQQFGLQDIIKRYKNAKYNKVLRLLPETVFSMMAITNFPLQAQSTLTKLMEYRLVNGVFLSWREFSFNEKVANPNLTEKEISAKFDELSKQSMYDFLDDNGEFDLEKMKDAGYTGDPKKSKLIVMSAIRDIAEQTTMEIASYNEGEGGRNPLASFVLTLKKWMVMSTSTMFSNRRFGQDGEEEGLIYSPKYIAQIFKSAIKDKETFRQAYDKLDEVERMNVKTSAAIGAMLTSLFVIAMMLKGLADDDENKDNYMVQLATYMALRGLNEAASGNVMLPEAYYEAIQNPIMIGSTLKNLTAIVNPKNIGETVSSGKYEGMSKFNQSVIKATYMKNIYSVSGAGVIGQTRNSYEHFNQNESLYHIFSLMPEKDKE